MYISETNLPYILPILMGIECLIYYNNWSNNKNFPFSYPYVAANLILQRMGCG